MSKGTSTSELSNLDEYLKTNEVKPGENEKFDSLVNELRTLDVEKTALVQKSVKVDDLEAHDKLAKLIKDVDIDIGIVWEELPECTQLKRF